MGDAFFEPKIQDLRSVKKEKERVLADNMSKIAEKVKKLDSINKMQTTRQAWCIHCWVNELGNMVCL